MSKQSAVLDPIDVTPNALTTPAPMTTGVEYPAGQTEILVPVFPLPDHPEGKQVFAPPFVVPLGLWTVIYTVQPLPDRTYVFDNVIYANPDAAVTIDNPGPSGGHTWSTTITNEVTEVNMLSCTIQLSEQPAPNVGSQPLRGDPTISVVKDPIDG